MNVLKSSKLNKNNDNQQYQLQSYFKKDGIFIEKHVTGVKSTFNFCIKITQNQW